MILGSFLLSTTTGLYTAGNMWLGTTFEISLGHVAGERVAGVDKTSASFWEISCCVNRPLLIFKGMGSMCETAKALLSCYQSHLKQLMGE